MPTLASPSLSQVAKAESGPACEMKTVGERLTMAFMRRLPSRAWTGLGGRGEPARKASHRNPALAILRFGAAWRRGLAPASLGVCCSNGFAAALFDL